MTLSALSSQSPGRVLHVAGVRPAGEKAAPVKPTSSKKMTDNSARADYEFRDGRVSIGESWRRRARGSYARSDGGLCRGGNSQENAGEFGGEEHVYELD